MITDNVFIGGPPPFIKGMGWVFKISPKRRVKKIFSHKNGVVDKLGACFKKEGYPRVKPPGVICIRNQVSLFLLLSLGT